MPAWIRSRRGVLLPLVGAALVALVAAGSARAQFGPGVSDTEIRIGNTMPYSGPTSAWSPIGFTMSAFFQMVNEQGGVNGRMINFISYDDGGSPPRTMEQTRRLVERDQVHLIFGSLGINHNLATRSYLNDAGIPQLFLAGALSAFDDPEQFPWTMRWNPSSYGEALVYGQHIEEHHPDAVVGVLYQNDVFGLDYVKGLVDILGEDRVIAVTYDLTDPTVDAQVAVLQGAGVDVFCNFAIPRFAIQAVRRSAELGWSPPMYLTLVSSAVEGVLRQAGVENVVGAISAGMIKDPGHGEWADDADVLEFQEFMSSYYPDGNPRGSFEAYGYAVASTMLEVLARAGDDLSRENIMRVAASLQNVHVPLLHDGIVLNTGPDDFAPIEQYRLARFDGISWVPLGPPVDVSDR